LRGWPLYARVWYPASEVFTVVNCEDNACGDCHYSDEPVMQAPAFDEDLTFTEINVNKH
jgi:hypothetical protein